MPGIIRNTHISYFSSVKNQLCKSSCQFFFIKRGITVSIYISIQISPFSNPLRDPLSVYTWFIRKTKKRTKICFDPRRVANPSQTIYI